MKTIRNWFTLSAALFVMLAAPAVAQSQGGFQYTPGPRMKFLVGAAVKDTTTILGQAAGTTIASCTDTTAWYDLSGYTFPPPAFTAQPTVKLEIRSSVATDSIGYLLQYRVDEDASAFTIESQAYAVPANSALAAVVTALTGDTLPARYFRVILWARDSGGVARTYSIRPLILGIKG